MIPKPYQKMHQTHPDLMQAYETFGKAARDSGPLSDREVSLVKLAISIGAALEGAAHSHCRKALDAGCTGDDLRHVAIIAAPTIGFPAMMRAKSWVEDVVSSSQQQQQQQQ
jgi:4-carboxymuconolactone decarboxylase